MIENERGYALAHRRERTSGPRERKGEKGGKILSPFPSTKTTRTSSVDAVVQNISLNSTLG